MKVGLVLEGGAMRGMYTAGVLDIFLDNNIKVDGIVGTSAGVLFGSNYISKQRGRTIRYNKKYIGDERYMSLKSLITTGNLVNKDFCYYELPTKLDVFDEEEFERSYIDFWATVTNVETGKPEYIKIKNVFKQMEVFRATSAMPFVSKMVEIDNKKYLDGGMADSIPVEKCKDLGYDKIIVVLTRPINYRKKRAFDFITNIVYRKYPNLVKTMNNRYKIYNDTADKIIDMENKNEIFVIRPSIRLKVKRVEKNPEKLQAMYDLGIEDCKNVLVDLKKYLES